MASNNTQAAATAVIRAPVDTGDSLGAFLALARREA